MFTEVLILLGIALIDSLNPVSISTHLILLTQVDKKNSAIAFIISTFATYLLSGLLIYFGVVAVLRSVGKTIFSTQNIWLDSIQLVIGIFLLGFAFFRVFHKNDKVDKSRNLSTFLLSVPGILILGLTSTIADVPTALPYLGWITHINDVGYSFFKVAILFFIYNLLYVLPLVVLQLLFVRNQERIEAATLKLKYWLRTISNWLIIGFSFLCGIWLCWNALESIAS